MEQKKPLSRFLSGGYIGLVLLFVYLPILYMIVFSFNDSKSMLNFTGFSLRWYEDLFRNRSLLESVSNTFVVAFLSTLVSTVLGTVSAIGLSKSRRLFRETVLEINNLPIMNPDIVTAIGLMLLFTSMKVSAGLVTLVLAHISFCTPFVILSIMPKLRQLDDNVAEAAMDLGATPFQALYKIILPQIYPAIFSGALIAFSMSLDDFVVSYFTKPEGFNTISTYVYTMRRYNYSVNALSTLIVAVVAVILILANVIPRITEKKNDKEEV